MPLRLGHRGAKLYAPENTISAFQLALDHGCDGFEFDVRRSVDGEAVIVHDPRVRGLEIANTSSSDLKRHLNCPLLTEVWKTFSGSFLDVELKVPGIENQVVDLWREQPPFGGMISSFLPTVIEEMHSTASEIPSGYICRDPKLLPKWKSLPLTDLIVHYDLVTLGLIREAHDNGLRLWAWTVNRKEEMVALAEAGVDGIISDDSKLLGSTLRR